MTMVGVELKGACWNSIRTIKHSAWLW